MSSLPVAHAYARILGLPLALARTHQRRKKKYLAALPDTPDVTMHSLTFPSARLFLPKTSSYVE